MIPVNTKGKHMDSYERFQSAQINKLHYDQLVTALTDSS